MAKVCPLTGKRPMRGHKVSHSNRKSNKRTYPNLQERRLWVPGENRWVKVRVSTAADLAAPVTYRLRFEVLRP